MCVKMSSLILSLLDGQFSLVSIRLVRCVLQLNIHYFLDFLSSFASVLFMCVADSSPKPIIVHLSLNFGSSVLGSRTLKFQSELLLIYSELNQLICHSL